MALWWRWLGKTIERERTIDDVPLLDGHVRLFRSVASLKRSGVRWRRRRRGVWCIGVLAIQLGPSRLLPSWSNKTKRGKRRSLATVVRQSPNWTVVKNESDMADAFTFLEWIGHDWWRRTGGRWQLSVIPSSAKLVLVHLLFRLCAQK